MSHGRGGSRFGGRRPSRAQLAREVDEEIQFHIEMRTRKLEESGLPPAKAREEAERRFGQVETVQQRCLALSERRERKRMRIMLLAELLQDIRFAVRSLSKRPGFTLAAVLTLTIGIGANSAIFSVFDAVLLRSLAFEDPQRLVSVWPGYHSMAELEGLREARSFSMLAAMDDELDYTYTGAEQPARLKGVPVTANFFETLGVRSLLGRTFLEVDGELGSERVVMLSHPLWQRLFNGNQDVLGDSISLDGRPHTVVGIMPPEFRFPTEAADFWVPIPMDKSNLGAWWGSYAIRMVGRLEPESDRRKATQEIRVIASRLVRENPVWTPIETYGQEATVEPLQIEMAGELGGLLGLLLGAVAVVLLIVCGNLANLQLAHSAARGRESAIRSSLGASRTRIMTLLLTESFMLAAVGTVLGLLLAQFAVDWIVPRLPGVDARFGAIGIDWRVIGFSILLAFITAFTFGLLPALRMSKVDLRSALAGTGPARDRIDSGLTRRALVLAQVALAVVLVVSAGLLLRSLWTLWQVEPGFQGSQVLSASLDPAEGFYAEPAKRFQFYGRVLERLAALPGVDSTAAAYGLPLTRMRMGLAHRVRGQQNEDGRLPVAQQRIVTPGYFRTMGIPILQGRDFRPGDDSEAPPVVIVNRQLAEQIWPGQSALGEAVGYPWPSDWLEVVGVVENVLLDDLAGGMEPIIYFPYAQRSMTSMTVLARTRLDPLSVGSSLRALVHEIDPNVPVNDIRTVDAVAWESIARPRFVATLLSLFAVTALLLGAIGIYGVIAYLVDQRRHEIGIRMALGASPGAIQTQFVKQGLMLAGAGLLIGMAGAFLATRWLQSLLFQVRATEPSILVLAAVTLSLTALLASYFPARRVTRVDPLKALKAD